MNYWDKINERVKKLNILDIKLCGLAGVVIGLIIGKLFPSIFNFSVWWFFTLYIIFIARPFYMFWIKK